MATRANAGYGWDSFDSESYFQHYYGEPHVDDEVVVGLASRAIARAQPFGRDLETVDIGTGPNLFPLLCALPRARRLTAWEFSSSNVAWLEGELAARSLRPQWAHFWNVVERSYPPGSRLASDPLAVLRERAEIRQGSVFDLPEATWDLATMFFCAESITGDDREFERACTRFVRCVKPGGSLVGAFLVGSSDYEVAGRPFPILDVSPDRIREVLEPMVRDLEMETIGLVDREIRSGYSGMLFASAVRREAAA
ncbi:NNMT/PNMT/TEMT family class I SAM-dependent methyltransferase [Aureimonas sp. AU22]|uniref:NNMT/PNMT/TEMT family class I SAM-dependent methyltransferase n=1 Tax=Aureimonas sp. AU22 TaxID=1638162 RepID=UPI000AB88B9C|nr:NNMT/PNMT/TEMT family class I SAM-dependent methyltransferase [Aureimonas sp. AU22]